MAHKRVPRRRNRSVPRWRIGEPAFGSSEVAFEKRGKGEKDSAQKNLQGIHGSPGPSRNNDSV